MQQLPLLHLRLRFSSFLVSNYFRKKEHAASKLNIFHKCRNGYNVWKLSDLQNSAKVNIFQMRPGIKINIVQSQKDVSSCSCVFGVLLHFVLREIIF